MKDFSEKSNILFSSLANCPSSGMTTNVVNNIADFAELWYPLYQTFLFHLPRDDPLIERRRFVEEYRRELFAGQSLVLLFTR